MGGMGSLLPAEWQRLCLGVGIGAGVRVWYHCRSIRLACTFCSICQRYGSRRATAKHKLGNTMPGSLYFTYVVYCCCFEFEKYELHALSPDKKRTKKS